MMQRTSQAASGFGRPWFALTVTFALHGLDEATTGFLNVYNPTVLAMRARFAWFPMPTFGFREWLVGLIAGVVLCFALTPLAARHERWLRPLAWFYALLNVLQRHGAHCVHDPGTHGGVGDVLAPRTGILFVAILIHWISVASGAVVEDGVRSASASRALYPLVVLSDLPCRQGSVQLVRTCDAAGKCIDPSPPKRAARDDKVLEPEA
jgi:hypothetical protein